LILLQLIEVTRDLLLEAAHIKANHPLSYAGAFVVAAALRHTALVLTGDPEFAAPEGIVKVEWLANELTDSPSLARTRPKETTHNRKL
jgi:predicted nucleic acid-binding protein